MSMDEFQYYPTPLPLAERLWGMFENRDFRRVLDPAAGSGDLLIPLGERRYGRRRVDCIELNPEQHPLLQSKGFRVVGTDFFTTRTIKGYTHIVMNPPFARGVQFVLRAWDLLWEGEIGAILNAETLRNPFSEARKHLLRLLEQHGRVEYVKNAFNGDGVKRKTDVEVALVYLRKKADYNADVIGNLLSGLSADSRDAADLASEFEEIKPLAIPATAIENLVLAFDVAVKTMVESVTAQAKAKFYASLLGTALSELGEGLSSEPEESVRGTSVEWVQDEVDERYEALKDRAWTRVLRSTEIDKRLSVKVRTQVEAEFEKIKVLDFTLSNVLGFLQGLVSQQGNLQIDLLCDVFDEIGKYHSDNTVYFMGWKSNSEHRTAGMKIKRKRFVLPGFRPLIAFSTSLRHEDEQRLADFDKAFAFLDGKSEPDLSMSDLFDKEGDRLAAGERLDATYFSCRWYPKSGTIHFFPRNQKLVDRLNLLVGRHRAWLPPADQSVSDDFTRQYEQAEKFDKEIRSRMSSNDYPGYRDPHWEMGCSDEAESNRAHAVICAAIGETLRENGIDPDALLLGSSDNLPATLPKSAA